jgi:hypothetical protein
MITEAKFKGVPFEYYPILSVCSFFVVLFLKLSRILLYIKQYLPSWSDQDMGQLQTKISFECTTQVWEKTWRVCHTSDDLHFEGQSMSIIYKNNTSRSRYIFTVNRVLSCVHVPTVKMEKVLEDGARVNQTLNLITTHQRPISHNLESNSLHLVESLPKISNQYSPKDRHHSSEWYMWQVI